MGLGMGSTLALLAWPGLCLCLTTEPGAALAAEHQGLWCGVSAVACCGRSLSVFCACTEMLELLRQGCQQLHCPWVRGCRSPRELEGAVAVLGLRGAVQWLCLCLFHLGGARGDAPFSPDALAAAHCIYYFKQL